MTSQFIEVFLFIDPLGKRCNNARKTIKQFRSERPEKIKLRVIPIVNFRSVYGYTRKMIRKTRESFVDSNNRFSTNTYQACLGFHASSMQGKNKAHDYLTLLQKNVVEDELDFTEDLSFEVAEEVGLDMEMFKDDYESELAEKIYRKNLRLASEMKIMGTPSCVIFKDGQYEEALRLDENIENEILHSVCGLEDLRVSDKGEEIHEEVEEELENVFNLN